MISAQADPSDLADFLALWLASSPSGSKETRRARRSDLEAWAQWRQKELLDALADLFGEGPLVAARDVQQWMAHLREERYSSKTIARRVASLRSLVSCAAEQGLPWRLSVRTVSPGTVAMRPGPSPQTVLQALKKTGRRVDFQGRRDHLLISLLWYGGLRRGEAASMDLDDWHPDAREITFRTKGGQTRRRKVPPELEHAIVYWILDRGRKPGPLLLGTHFHRGVRKHISGSQILRICRSYGLGHPHGLRHTAASVLARVYGRLDLAQAHLGHRNVGTTSVYLDRGPDDAGEASLLLEQLSSAPERLEPFEHRIADRATGGTADAEPDAPTAPHSDPEGP